MTYCVQERWVVGNTVIMVCGNMLFLHNRCEREEQTRGSNPGVLAIILALNAVVAWNEARSNPHITTFLYSKNLGRFVGIRMYTQS